MSKIKWEKEMNESQAIEILEERLEIELFVLSDPSFEHYEGDHDFAKALSLAIKSLNNNFFSQAKSILTKIETKKI